MADSANHGTIQPPAPKMSGSYEAARINLSYDLQQLNDSSEYNRIVNPRKLPFHRFLILFTDRYQGYFEIPPYYAHLPNAALWDVLAKKRHSPEICVYFPTLTLLKVEHYHNHLNPQGCRKKVFHINAEHGPIERWFDRRLPDDKAPQAWQFLGGLPGSHDFTKGIRRFPSLTAKMLIK